MMANKWEGSKPVIVNIQVPEIKKIKQPSKYYVSDNESVNLMVARCSREAVQLNNFALCAFVLQLMLPTENLVAFMLAGLQVGSGVVGWAQGKHIPSLQSVLRLSGIKRHTYYRI